jgi:hypothetical protein
MRYKQEFEGHPNTSFGSPLSMFLFPSPSYEESPFNKDGRPSLNSSNIKLVVSYKASMNVI